MTTKTFIKLPSGKTIDPSRIVMVDRGIFKGMIKVSLTGIGKTLFLQGDDALALEAWLEENVHEQSLPTTNAGT